MGDNKALPVPKGTIPLPHQVAGHSYADGRLGFLLGPSGQILKPVQAPPKGERELKFYQQVFGPEGDPCLRPLLPGFHGTWESPEVPGTTYMIMDDLAAGFTNPSIADVKIGPRTYDPEATPEKIAAEKSKYKPLEKVGFQLRGMRVYNCKTKSTTYYGKKELRCLDETDLLDKGLGLFFNNGAGLRKDAVHACLQQLRVIETWFLNQRHYAFYASSTLLLYEGGTTTAAVCIDQEVLGAKTQGDSCPVGDARMIDFAHVFPTSERDDNYLFGLQSLIQYLEALLHKPDDLN